MKIDSAPLSGLPTTTEGAGVCGLAWCSPGGGRLWEERSGVGPGARFLDLGGERQQGCLAACGGDELDGGGHAVLVEAGRYRCGGVAELVPDRGVGDVGAGAVEGAHRALALPFAHGLGLRGGDRREQHVVAGEDGVDSRGVDGLAAQAEL